MTLLSVTFELVDALHHPLRHGTDFIVLPLKAIFKLELIMHWFESDNSLILPKLSWDPGIGMTGPWMFRLYFAAERQKYT